MDYITVCGLEVHTELATKTKIFCNCTTEFGGEPNTHVCEICSGMPGTLPVVNKKVVEFAVRTVLLSTAKSHNTINSTEKTIFIPTFRRLTKFHSFISRFAATAGLKSTIQSTAAKRRSEFTKFIWRRTQASLFTMSGPIQLL